jgi:hypothetical protein
MIIFNTTFHVDRNVADEWIDYVKKEYIPAAMAGGQLTEPILAEVLHHVHDEGFTFALQFKVADQETLETWAEAVGTAVSDKMVSKFGSKAVGFTTMLQEISIK